MNDDTDKPLNTVGDDALEARITAWVLGEASSFEAGELEKLCAADPALGLFERRLRVLHGLVAEDFKAGPAAEWKLSAARRAKITDLLGVEPEVEQVLPRRKSRRGSSVRGLILALAACVVIGVASYSLLGGVGMTSDMAMVKESARVVNYSAPASDIRAEVDSIRLERESLRLEREGGAPVTKPDTSYAHLGTNSPFSSKPPPADIEQVAQPRGAVARNEDVADDQRKLLSAVEAKQQSHYRHTADAGIAGETTVDAKAELDMSSNSLALLKEDAAGLPEQQIASRSKAQGIAGPAPAPATPAPAAKPAALAASGLVLTDPDSDGSKGRGFVGGGLVGGGSGGGAPGGRQAEAALETAGRTNADFIGTVDGVMIPGIPAAPGQKVEDIVTAGNRSGDGAISRNNIDAILNNPDRLAKDAAKGDGIAADTGVWADNELAPLEKAVEEKQEGFKTWLESDVAGGPEVEFKTRIPNPGEPANGAFGRGGVASLADADGMLLEPEAESRFARGLQTGGEQVMGQVDAADFGNQEELSRLSRNRQQVELGNNFSYSDSTNGGGTGGTELMDLAKKQNEGDPDTAAAGRWFGTATDETTKGLKDTNAPSGATADLFFDSLPLVGKPLGGLKRDLSEEVAAAREGARARLLEEVDKAWELSVPPVDADEFDGFINQGTPIADESADGPVPVTPAPAVTDPAAMEEVRRKLYIAEGGYNLGKYDDAHRAYEEVLRIDPYNKAARRGMEQVAMARQDYYRAAYDQTRAKLLTDVDGRANTSVDSEKVSELKALLDFKKAIPDTKSGTYTGLAQKEMLRRQNAVAQSDKLREEGRTAYAANNFAEAYRKNVEALELLPDVPMVKDRRDYIQQVIQNTAEALSMTAERVGEKELAAKWMEKSVEWALKKEAPPKPVVVEPTAETVAADEPFSTFSLHVSEASFKLAQAAMERGEVPAAEGIRPEEFYNAFDYGDPAPASGEPVVCVTEQSAHPAFAQRNLLRIGVRTGSQGRGASTPLNLTLLLDHSGSMEREDRNAGLAMAVRQLSGLLKEGDTITVAGFSRQPRLLADRLPGARAQELNELIARTPSEGGTNLEEGLKLGEELAKRQFNPAAQNRVVLFTDGAANLGDARPEALQARIEGLRQQGIAFDAAGFGADGLNDKLLERLTRNGNGRYYVVDGPEDADAGFAKQLAGAFRPAAENVKVQVRFNPARVAKYKLIGFEEHRLKKEDFRNDAVDAAEMAAEEAGNALYQIETLPQGEGEVGEVSVRFRDVASGQMVERTWTIPYDAQAPAFDQATPSIQLAGLAAFTAEKLRAAPMADAVDFQQLGQVYAGVRARYPNSQPVADLGSMIGKMK